MLKEIWKDIPGLDGYYMASSFGRFKRMSKPLTAGARGGGTRQMVFQERILKLSSSNKNGYLSVGLCLNGRNFTKMAHRLIAITFLSPVEGKRFVNHIDGDKHNNNISNLEWCTENENMMHSYHVLKNQNVNKILILNTQSGIFHESIVEVSKTYNIPFSTITAYMSGRLPNKTPFIKA